MIEKNQQINLELSRLCKKQQKTIVKLQNQIRERCQSYLIHVSQYKRSNNLANNLEDSEHTLSKSSSKVSEGSCDSKELVEKSDKKSFEDLSSSYAFKFQKENCNQMQIYSKVIDLWYHPQHRHHHSEDKITKIQINLQENDAVFYQQVIQSLKGRLIEINKSKNLYLEELELIKKQNKQFDRKAKQLQVLNQKLQRNQSKNILNLEKINLFKQAFKKIQNFIFTINHQQKITTSFDHVENFVNQPERLIELITKCFENLKIQKQNWQKKISEFQLSSEKTNLFTNYNASEIKNQLSIEDSEKKNEKLEFELSSLKKQYNCLFEELQRSRMIHFNNNKQTNEQKNESKIYQQLQPPYYVEEDLKNDHTNPYIKRSFIRKKIIKRNLSVTSYRTISRDKSQILQLIQEKYQELKDKQNRHSFSPFKNNFHKTPPKNKIDKINALQEEIEINRVSQVSRESDYSNKEEEEEVKVIQIQTSTPKQIIYTTKICTNQVKNSNFRRRN